MYLTAPQSQQGPQQKFLQSTVRLTWSLEDDVSTQTGEVTGGCEEALALNTHPTLNPDSKQKAC